MEMLGDRWSLLIVRDLMVRGFTTFREFKESGEGIATNILADRLQKLRAARIIDVESNETDGRSLTYRLTEKGIDLAPVVLELLLWASRHEKTSMAQALRQTIEHDRASLIAEVRRRWSARDTTPLLPRFGSGARDESKKGKQLGT